MQLNKAEYTINGIEVIMERIMERAVKVIWETHTRICYYEDDNQCWDDAASIFSDLYGYKGTKLDVAEIHRAIMAFEN